MEKVNVNLITGELSNAHRTRNFHKLMKVLVNGVGIVIPMIFGIWRYQTTSEPNRLFDGIWIGFLSVFFSSGLWLSVTRIGRRFRFIVLSLIIFGIPVHLLFFSLPLLFLILVVFVEIYAIYSLFRKAIT